MPEYGLFFVIQSQSYSVSLGMAHDLRTPLTGLMTFLEIARKQDRQEDTISYLDKSYDKALQIRSLSDQMFDFFLINSEKQIHLEEPESAESALGDYLSELCALLQMDGSCNISITETDYAISFFSILRIKSNCRCHNLALW